jgi:3-oxoacyl-[acyl-carrier-protein] synthase-1
MGGHALGAAGAHEAIHCISMLQHGYLAPSINIDELDPKFEGLPIVRQTREHPVRVAVSNSFAFGGANASLVFKAA